MEHPAPSAISIFLLVVLFAAGCSHADKPNVSLAARTTDDVLLQTIGDTTFYAGKKYNGLAFQLSQLADTIVRIDYRAGVRDGVTRIWYENGQLAEERYYQQGQKEGPQKGWWSSGKKRYEFIAVDDHYEGAFSEWNPQGLLIKSFHYVDGQESGTQQLWYDDGKTRANYIIKNGRRYGLLGTKNCRNVSDSVF